MQDSALETRAVRVAGPSSCAFCRSDLGPGDPAGESLDPNVLLVILANDPRWRPEAGVCRACVERLVTTDRKARSRHRTFARGALPILPTPLRLGAVERYRGRGVTIAFLDSGFYAHPDLVEPRNRIRAYADVTRGRARRPDLRRPQVSSGHGLMTSAVACGNGRLSRGLYRGLASEADLVLVKVGSARRIAHDAIRRGLEWVIRNRRRHGIRIVSVSCGGDYEASYLHDALSRAVEEATRCGLLVCVAAGNSAHLPGHPVIPPASAPSALTVGGLDDQNRLAFSGYDLWPSSYGPTVDGLQKPEVIAPGIWVAAPILPGTPTAERAALLARLARARDEELAGILAASPGVDEALEAAAGLDPPLLRRLVEATVREQNLISGAYKHVDGTSVAAPIVASVAAQMLEANPALAPQELKRILIRTAHRLPHVEADRQGWGVVDARRAVEHARRSAAAGRRRARDRRRR